MSCVRPRRWSGIQEIHTSDGHWTITAALQGSFDCPTPHMGFDLEHWLNQRPAVQPAEEGRWHMYHVDVDGREEEVKAAEDKLKRTQEGGRMYEWRLTMLLHESKPLNKNLADKVVGWLLSSNEHQMWFGDQRKNRQHKAFYVDKDDWTPVKQVEFEHEMIFIGHPSQNVDDIAETYKTQAKAEKAMKDHKRCSSSGLGSRWCNAEKVFDHGCMLAKVGNVFGIKDNYGFVLIVREQG